MLLFQQYSHAQESKLKEIVNSETQLCQPAIYSQMEQNLVLYKPTPLTLDKNKQQSEKELCMQQWEEFDKTRIMPSLFESFSFLDAEINNRLEEIANYFGKDAELEIKPSGRIELSYTLKF